MGFRRICRSHRVRPRKIRGVAEGFEEGSAEDRRYTQENETRRPGANLGIVVVKISYA